MTTATASNEFLGHPKGLYVCFMTEMWERFAFYGMKALLVLYLTKYHLFADGYGTILMGTYAGLAYALTLLGGIVSDRWLGMRKSVLFGGILLVIGQLGMAYTGERATGTVDAPVRDAVAMQVMYLSLGLIAVGIGFLKPNISTIVGRLYPDGDPRRDSGFSVFYMGINLGATIGGIIVGYIGEVHGWGYGFAISGVMMAVGLIQFQLGQKHLMGHAEPPERIRSLSPGSLLLLDAKVYLFGIGLAVLSWWMLQTNIDFAPLTKLAGGHAVTLTELVAVTMSSALLAWFAWFLFQGLSSLERNRMILLMLLIVSSALFWGIYEQTYGIWVTFADRAMDKQVLGLNVLAAQTTSIGSIFVLIWGPVFALLWPYLDKRGMNPSLTAKFGWAMILCGLATGVLMYAARHPGSEGLVSLWWLIAAYSVLVLGEMMLSPIGLSAVTSLSVPRVVGTMMGAWFLASAFGEMIAGRFGAWGEIKPKPDGTFDIPSALITYADVFERLMWIGIIAGIVMLLIAPLMKKMAKA